MMEFLIYDAKVALALLVFYLFYPGFKYETQLSTFAGLKNK